MSVANTAAGIEAMNQILAGWLGPNRAVGSPASYKVHAWFDNPQGDTPSEVDFTGYTPATWDADDWETPDGGEIQTSALVSLGTPTGASTDAARYWSLHRTSDDALVYSAPLRNPTYVTAGDPFQIRPTIPFGGRS